jgi:hypothetical protein
MFFPRVLLAPLVLTKYDWLRRLNPDIKIYCELIRRTPDLEYNLWRKLKLSALYI